MADRNVSGESKNQEIRRLLSGEQLEDRYQPELFRVMQRRSESHDVADSLLLELFLRQLSPNLQSILTSIQPFNVQNATEIADRILKVMPVQASAVSEPPVLVPMFLENRNFYRN
ncbi:hypothetical protein AVEN_30149-1 [Araneus ventricosus]|uniref:Uncharacterized protein n=1 Tax=Araneus ventricosus TaxID=182803 RepID=A0A4Y2Q2V0_ARAVE|nr:hypothetical protein AVEN_30149-1 [Araneus ventricosus]